MLEKIKKYVREHDMIKKEDRIILGVSGGADSVCLLFVFLELQKEIGFEIVVVHVNHMLRGEDADRDEAFVRELCKENNLKCCVFSGDVELFAKNWKQSTEEAGRNFRRECFAKAMEQYGGTKIGLAHHKNDNVETFLMNLARGTGLKGLGGMAAMQDKVIRPLLCVERKEIEQYLVENGIAFCIDETNKEDIYTRNRVRNQVLPMMEQNMNARVIEHVDESMRYLRDVQQFLEEQMLDYRETCVYWNGGLVLKEEEFRKVPDVLKSLLIKRCLSEISGQEKDLESVHVREVDELRSKQVGKKLDLPYGVEAKRVYEGIRFSKKEYLPEKEIEEILFEPGRKEYVVGRYCISCEVTNKEQMGKYAEKSSTKWFDYDIIKSGICFRTRRQGDYITIDESGRTQKLKAYFINNKIPQEKRDSILVIAEGSHILCVWGYRMNCAYQVTEQTKRVLGITVDEGEESWQKESMY